MKVVGVIGEGGEGRVGQRKLIRCGDPKEKKEDPVAKLIMLLVSSLYLLQSPSSIFLTPNGPDIWTWLLLHLQLL